MNDRHVLVEEGGPDVPVHDAPVGDKLRVNGPVLDRDLDLVQVDGEGRRMHVVRDPEDGGAGRIEHIDDGDGRVELVVERDQAHVRGQAAAGDVLLAPDGGAVAGVRVDRVGDAPALALAARLGRGAFRLGQIAQADPADAGRIGAGRCTRRAPGCVVGAEAADAHLDHAIRDHGTLDGAGAVGRAVESRRSRIDSAEGDRSLGRCVERRGVHGVDPHGTAGTGA